MYCKCIFILHSSSTVLQCCTVRNVTHFFFAMCFPCMCLNLFLFLFLIWTCLLGSIILSHQCRNPPENPLPWIHHILHTWQPQTTILKTSLSRHVHTPLNIKSMFTTTDSLYIYIYIWSNTLCAYLNLPSLLIQWLIFWFLILPCFFMFQAPEHIYSDDTAQTPVQFSLHAH